MGQQWLELLNKTDIKWIIEQWGEPDEHTTLHKMHFGVWLEYEAKLKEKRKQQDQEFINDIKKIRTTEKRLPKPSEKPKGSNDIIWIVAIFLVALLLVAVFGAK